MKEKDLFKYLKIAKTAALKSGKILIKNYKNIYLIENKGIRDIVTEIDKKSESFIKNYFKKLTPGFKFFGEETGGEIEDFTWVVDPLDGTKNYVHKIPYFGVSIALVKDLKPMLGVVYFPILDEIYYSIENHGAFMIKGFKKIKLNTSSNSDISKSFIATGFPHSKSHLVSNYIVELENILKNVSAVRRLGSAAYDLCSVASGKFDAFWEYGLECWDMAAGALIAKEAGAFICSLENYDWNIKSNSIFVSNQKLSKKLLEIINFPHEKDLN